MCVSVSRGVRVNFSETVLYGAEVSIGGETRHVLGYQNKALNGAGEVAPNGDFVLELASVRESKFRPSRERPPGAN